MLNEIRLGGKQQGLGSRDAWWQVSVTGLLLAFFGLYAVPAHPKFSVCGFLWLTGRPCPLCGMTRAISALAHGQWLDGLRFNALSPVILLILCAGLVRGILRLLHAEPEWSFVSGILRRNFWSFLVILFIGYGLLRFVRLLP